MYRVKWYTLQWHTPDGVLQERWFRDSEVSDPD